LVYLLAAVQSAEINGDSMGNKKLVVDFVKKKKKSGTKCIG
jgi:hypothetical protein